jgi:hypothetical protein
MSVVSNRLTSKPLLMGLSYLTYSLRVRPPTTFELPRACQFRHPKIDLIMVFSLSSIGHESLLDLSES